MLVICYDIGGRKGKIWMAPSMRGTNGFEAATDDILRKFKQDWSLPFGRGIKIFLFFNISTFIFVLINKNI